jgi:hypothetical protein
MQPSRAVDGGEEGDQLSAEMRKSARRCGMHNGVVSTCKEEEKDGEDVVREGARMKGQGMS